MDPNLDPELALALRVSMEEERARQEAAAKAAEEASKKEQGEQQSTSQDVTMSENVQAGSSEAENRTADLMVCFFIWESNCCLAFSCGLLIICNLFCHACSCLI